MREMLPLIASSGAYTAQSLLYGDEVSVVARGKKAFGSLEGFDAALKSLSQFLLNR